MAQNNNQNNNLEIKEEMDSCLKNLRYYVKKIHDLVWNQLTSDYSKFDMWEHEADMRAEALKGIAACQAHVEFDCEIIAKNMEYASACKMKPLAPEKLVD